MPPRLRGASSIGVWSTAESQNTTGESVVSAVRYDTAPIWPHDDQSPRLQATALRVNEAAGTPPQELPVDVAVPPPIPTFGQKAESSWLRRRQLWEGTVMETTDEGFRAQLYDKTNPSYPDEEAVFDFCEVSDEDRQLVFPGSGFHWVIGTESTRGGQVKNVSILSFRRLPRWSKRSLQRALQAADPTEG